MAGIQHDQGKRKLEEEHAFERESRKRWSECNNRELEHPAGPHGGQTLSALPGTLQSTPGEIPLQVESAGPSSPYPGVRLANEQAFAGEHRNPNVATNAQGLADVAQYDPLPQTNEPYSAGAPKPCVASEPTPSPSYVMMPDPDGHLGYYCMATECFIVTTPFGSLEEFRTQSGKDCLASLSTLASASSVQASYSAALQPDEATASPLPGQTSPASPEASKVDADELSVLRRVARFPIEPVIRIVNSVQVLVFCCMVEGCKWKGIFETEKLVRKHQRCHIPKHERPFLCGEDGCLERFLYDAYRLRHRKEMHYGVQYRCTLCEYQASKYHNVYGKGRHFEKQHPGGNKPKPDEVRVVPDARSPSPTRSSQANATPLPPHTPRPDTAPRRQPAHSPRTPGAPSPQSRHYQVEYHAIPADNVTHAALANSHLRSPFGQSHTQSGPSSSRKSSVATPLSCYSSTTMSHQPSDGFSSRISQASTAPTSISDRSGGRGLYSDAARRAPRSPASPSTPTRASRGIAPASPATITPSRGQSSRYTYGGGSFDIPVRAARSDHCFGGPGSRKRS
ncbi:hypothetical protein LTR56_003845 [Elasticomyces elasticus]|nr:hypothetical protein LTR56_003845 [Elasticomyces elasticus]